jgi:hypothetical protein
MPLPDLSWVNKKIPGNKPKQVQTLKAGTYLFLYTKPVTCSSSYSFFRSPSLNNIDKEIVHIAL